MHVFETSKPPHSGHRERQATRAKQITIATHNAIALVLAKAELDLVLAKCPRDIMFQAVRTEGWMYCREFSKKVFFLLHVCNFKPF